MDDGVKHERPENLRQNANPLSIITFCYTLPTFFKYYKKELEEEDLPKTWNKHRSTFLGNKLAKAWEREEARAKKTNRTPSLFRALKNVFVWEFLLLGLTLAIGEFVIRLAQPYALGQLISYYTKTQNVTVREAYFYSGAIVACSLLNCIFMHPYMLGCLHLGMKMRVACCSLIYRKALRLSKAALGETTAGQMVNLLSNDVNRFDVALLFVHQLWLAPLETVIVTYLLYLQIGWSALIGVAVLLIFIPLQIYLGKRTSVLRLRTAIRTDERVRFMNEIISGIQVIKMYTWEKPFALLVAQARKNEIDSIRITSYFRGILMSFIIFTTRIAIYVSIVSYVLMGYGITAEQVFVLTSFYGILRTNMTVFFPQGIGQVAEALVSVRRLNKFLVYGEIATPTFEKSGIVNGEKKFTEVREQGLVLKNVVARWRTGGDPTLNDVSLTARPGRLVAIIGPVGAGKSSLLSSILRELPLTSGSIELNGEVSYASQEPWLFAGSVRQNILFGQAMDKVRYRMVVKKCSLQRDFDLFPYGDRTIVGERGVSLSGGQRARINLARAVYKQADVYLLDDPLSAVDTHVGKELFDNCVTGYLKEKTCILVTHQLQYLKDVDDIIIMQNGVILAQGNYQTLSATGLDFAKMMQLNEETIDEDNKTVESESSAISRRSSLNSITSDASGPKQVQEQRSKGSVGGYVYKAYLKSASNACVITCMVLLFILSQGAGSAADYFTAYWVNLEQLNATVLMSEDTWSMNRTMCIYIYTCLAISVVVFTLWRSFAFFSLCMRASVNLHDKMFRNITRASMHFFNTNTSGRILNRFSKDIGSIDELLPVALIDCLQIGLSLIGIIAVVASVAPYVLIPTVLIGIIFVGLRKFYLRTGRAIKRLEGVTRSPVFSHLNASLQGLTTIRAFKAQAILEREFDNHQDLHSSAWYLFLSTSRSFGFYCDVMCVVYIAFVTFGLLILGNNIQGGDIGLAITQAIGLTGMFQWGMRQSTELENQMTSVERVLEYSNLKPERAFESDEGKKPSADWPSKGEIEFKNLYLRYSPNEPPVLRNLNFLIRPKEKVGIIGRTGAGKSSLIAALFQLTDTEGLILIDGIDTKPLGLHDLRSKISIIPQEPVLFSGTMRKNLDPFDNYEDEVLWKALEDVELKDTVAELPASLNSRMSEGGTNFSVGQRQLVCLARAIIRSNKVLVLDEATANVDPHTDGLIQTTIRQKFADCTVLTIAHRLHTIVDSDKVLVMDAGRMVEFDHPYVLMQNKEGVMYGMVEQMGKGMKDVLLRVAQQHYEKRKNSDEGGTSTS